MKYLVFSDLHGSYEYANKIIEKFNELNCDKLLCLGDVLYHGPRNDLPNDYNPKKVISLLNEYSDKFTCVKGNCDAEVDQMVLDFEIQDSFEFKVNNVEYLLVHGHHLDFDGNENKVVIYGHTHIYDYKKVNDTIYVNPGSTTIPKSDCKHSFAILEDNVFKVFDFNMDILLEVDFNK